MRRLMPLAWWSLFAVVCLGVLAPPAGAQVCPELVGVLPGAIGVVTASGDYAYLCGDCYTNGGDLHIADVSHPSVPEVVGQIEMPELDIHQIAVQGGYAYVVGTEFSSGSLRVIDVANPRAPVEVGRFDVTDASATTVTVSGANAYVGYFIPGGFPFRVLDVSDPQHPVEVGTAPTHWVYDVAVADHYAYVSSGDIFLSYLEVIDVSDPSAPVVLVTIFYFGGQIAVDNSYLYAAGGSGLRVIDVSDPSNPVEVSFVDLPDGAGDVAVSSGFAYVTDYPAGLRVIDVSHPTAPVEVGFVDTDGLPTGVSVSDGYVFVADGNGGLKIFRECGVFSDSFESGDTSMWSQSVP